MDCLGHSGDSNFAPSPRLARRGKEKESSLRATHPFSRVGGGGGRVVLDGGVEKLKIVRPKNDCQHAPHILACQI